MGMFDSLYDQHGTEWQTKAFDCLLDSYQIGDELPGPPIDYQVEILGGRPECLDGYATVTAGRLTALGAQRDHTLPLMDYMGGWPKPEEATIRCDHDTTWSHVDGETICDACEEVVGDE